MEWKHAVSNSKTSLSIGRSKKKQKVLKAVKFYSPKYWTQKLKPPGMLGTNATSIEVSSGSSEVNLAFKHRKLHGSGTGFIRYQTVQSDNGLTDYYKTFCGVKCLSSSAHVNQPLMDSDDILGLLAVAEHRNIDFLPFQCDNSNPIGIGGTAKITRGAKISTNRGDKEYNFGLVFKRTQSEIEYKNRAEVFRAVLSEVYILGHPVVRHHPNISSLQGICWEIIHNEPWPVLIFKQAPYGDLGQFMKSGIELEFKDKIKICWEIGNALQLMHKCSNKKIPGRYKGGVERPSDHDRARYAISQQKGTPQFATYASEMVLSLLDSSSGNSRQRSALDGFFGRVLSYEEGSGNQTMRGLDIDTLPRLFGLPERRLPLLEQYGKSFLSESQASFKLPALLSRLSRCPQAVLRDVFKPLEQRAKSGLHGAEGDWDANSRNLACNVALCYQLGLGVNRNSEKAGVWLDIAGLTHKEPDDLVGMMESDTNSFYSSYNSDAKEITNTEHQAVGFSAPWLHRVLELKELKKVTSFSHPLWSRRETKKTFIAWMQLDLLTQKDPRSVLSLSSSPSHLIVFPTSATGILDLDLGLLVDKELQILTSLKVKKNVIGSEHQDTLHDMNKLYNL
ncbi:hypothetical protein TWF594_004831 [Orbilia oligospora]|nr:hypothetical protein TWF594_004831 [Orbilia oligospora]